MSYYRLWIFFVWLDGCSSCQTRREDESPQEVVQNYLNLVFHMEDLSQRDSLVRRTTGELRRAWELVDEKTFAEIYLSSRYLLESFSWLNEKIMDDSHRTLKCHIVYKEKSEKNSAQLTHEVELLMEKTPEGWAISSILGSQSHWLFSP